MSDTSHLYPSSQDTINAFVRAVGDAHAIREEADMVPYLTEWRDCYRGKVALVLKPGSTDEVASILKCANEARTAIVPHGVIPALSEAEYLTKVADNWWYRLSASTACVVSI